MSFPNVRNQFPALTQKIHDHSLVYLDSAATTLKPQSVVQALSNFYLMDTANVHRGSHFLGDRATQLFEEAREKVAHFIGAPRAEEIIFTKGTTDGINLVASSWCDQFLKSGDEILLTELEHHSNIVPWQIAAAKQGARIRVLPITDDGQLDLTKLPELLSSRTKMVAFTLCSNALGVVPPARELIKAAHEVGAKVLVDAAQAMTFMPIDVQALGCDFLVFSGHKMFGPFGVGVLWAHKEMLESLPPYQGGGSMIAEVSWEKTTYLGAPHRFEAGTPAIAEVVAMTAALDFLNGLEIPKIAQFEHGLVQKAYSQLSVLPGLRVFGPSLLEGNIVSFVMDQIHPSDVGALLNEQGVAVRVGHHCCQPLMKRLGVSGTVRASFSVYNNEEDVSRLVSGVIKAKELLG